MRLRQKQKSSSSPGRDSGLKRESDLKQESSLPATLTQT
jgi:hypothetical protein